MHSSTQSCLLHSASHHKRVFEIISFLLHLLIWVCRCTNSRFNFMLQEEQNLYCHPYSVQMCLLSRVRGYSCSGLCEDDLAMFTRDASLYETSVRCVASQSLVRRALRLLRPTEARSTPGDCDWMGPTVWVRLHQHRAGRHTDNATGWYHVNFPPSSSCDQIHFHPVCVFPHPIAIRFTSIQFVFSSIQL